MNIYHIWCNLRPGVRDIDFTDAAQTYLTALQEAGRLVSFRITRAKLGLAPSDLPEFHLMLEFENLAQLDEAFTAVSERSNPLESFHHGVNSLVRDVRFALYRDFPDSHRQRGQERF